MQKESGVAERRQEFMKKLCGNYNIEKTEYIWEYCWLTDNICAGYTVHLNYMSPEFTVTLETRYQSSS